MLDPLNTDWAIAEGHTGEYPYQVRFRKLPRTFDCSGHTKRLNVFWSMASSSNKGMATTDELGRLHVFEERLVNAVEYDGSAILAAVLTGRGEREFVYYVHDAQDFVARLSNMPHEAERYPIELHAADDPEWEYYKSIIPPTAEPT